MVLLPNKKKKIIVFEIILWTSILAIVFGIFIKYRQSQPANILLITVDTLRADFLGCYGNPQVKTPTIDSLAKQGVLFSTAVCEMSTTTPSHASILTSLTPRVHGILTNSWKLSDTITTLPEILKLNEYTTGGFVSVRHLERKLGFAQGFDHFDDNFPGLQRNATQVTNVALDWVSKNQNKKWFIWLHYFDPHTPYEPPEPFKQLYPAVNNGSKLFGSFSQISAMEEKKLTPTPKDIERLQALYSGEISYVDSELGRLFDVLNKMGLTKKTIIILLADHGESFDHDIYANHDQVLYESSVRIPLIIIAPKQIPQGKRIDTLVQSIDIMPTILELLKLKPDTFMQGKSLLGLIRGKKPAPEPTVVIERRYYQNQQDCLRRHIPVGARYAIRTQNWKYIWSEFAPLELYNLGQDPGETNNLIKTQPEIKNKLHQYFDQWLNENNKLRKWAYQKIDEQTAEQLKSLGYIQ
jgi:arylsulfatase A-like enzyme